MSEHEYEHCSVYQLWAMILLLYVKHSKYLKSTSYIIKVQTAMAECTKYIVPKHWVEEQKGSRNTNCVRKYQMLEWVRIECWFPAGTEPIKW